MNQPNRADSMAVRLFFYPLVVWAALILAQSLGGGLPDIITNLTAAMEHPFRIQWTDHSLVTILLCTGAYIMGICLYADQQGRTRDGEEHGSAAWASPGRSTPCSLRRRTSC